MRASGSGFLGSPAPSSLFGPKNCSYMDGCSGSSTSGFLGITLMQDRKYAPAKEESKKIGQLASGGEHLNKAIKRRIRDSDGDAEAFIRSYSCNMTRAATPHAGYNRWWRAPRGTSTNRDFRCLFTQTVRLLSELTIFRSPPLFEGLSPSPSLRWTSVGGHLSSSLCKHTVMFGFVILELSA